MQASTRTDTLSDGASVRSPGTSRRKLSLAAIVALLITGAAAPAAQAARDWDGDGFVPPADCGPLDPAVNPSAPDRPDLAFEDRNCDGIDGDRSKAIFVSLGGNDAAPGTLTNPVRTIQKGVALASAQGKDVYVAGGEYAESVAVADGVGIYGGYEPITGKRTRDQVTIIRGGPAILAVGDAGVLVQNITLRGTPDGSGNAYAIRAVSNGPTPSRMVLEGVTAEGLTAQNGANGGTGASGTTGAGFGGGTGGAGGCGPAGLGTPGGAGGGGLLGGTPSGGTGKTGSSPGPGANNGFALVDQPTWPRPLAGTATAGGHGGGGGGGHGGAGRTFSLAGTQLPLCGGAGGGGGSGGSGGSPGGRGQNGAGSFGAYLFNSSLTAVDSMLTGGTAGRGGNGGNGGFGGAGQSGGSGVPGECVPIFSACADDGSPGGSGGSGGRGGGGGAGAGGPSAGVYQAGAGSGYTSKGTTTLRAGAVALGGTQGNTGIRAASGQSGGHLRTPTAPAVSTADFDGDGVNDTADKCPADPQGAGGAGGCPARAAKLADRDGDGVPDGKDACPSVAVSGPDANEDGCTDVVVVPAPPAAPAPPPAPAVVIVQPSQTQQINVTLAFNYSASRTSTRLNSFQVRGIPGGATVTAKCKGKGCPKVKRKAASFTKRNAFDRVTLKPWVRKRLPVKTTITVTVTRPGMHGQVKKLVVQGRKAPRVTTTCIADGSTRTIPCAS